MSYIVILMSFQTIYSINYGCMCRLLVALNSLQVKDLLAKMQSLAIYFSWNWINILFILCLNIN